MARSAPAPDTLHRRQPLVLLAEDDAEFRRLLVSVLEEAGYEVVEAEDGLALLATIEDTLTVRRERPDAFLVVADVRMPGLTGLDVLAILRCANWATPVILITAFGDEANAQAKSALTFSREITGRNPQHRADCVCRVTLEEFLQAGTEIYIIFPLQIERSFREYDPCLRCKFVRRAGGNSGGQIRFQCCLKNSFDTLEFAKHH